VGKWEGRRVEEVKGVMGLKGGGEKGRRSEVVKG
jgi:hypothetical protein